MISGGRQMEENKKKETFKSYLVWFWAEGKWEGKRIKKKHSGKNALSWTAKVVTKRDYNPNNFYINRWTEHNAKTNLNFFVNVDEEQDAIVLKPLFSFDMNFELF